MRDILVVAEHGDGGVRTACREVFAMAAELAEATNREWFAMSFGSVASGLEGPPRWIQVRHTADGGSDPDSFAAAVVHVVKVQAPEIILLAATATGRDVAARVAEQLGVSLAQDASGYRVADNGVLLTRTPYGGKVITEVEMHTNPWVATMRPRAFAPLAGTNVASTETVDAELPLQLLQVRREKELSQHRLDVTEAEIVVSGGRGMQGPEHWGILEALVDALGPRATLACSRPVSDTGWRPRSEHVGQTGRTIAPDLYIACGISGATQHVAGIAGSKYIVAINNDPDAPIFRVANYGIVGDLFEVVPALTRQLTATS